MDVAELLAPTRQALVVDEPSTKPRVVDVRPMVLLIGRGFVDSAAPVDLGVLARRLGERYRVGLLTLEEGAVFDDVGEVAEFRLALDPSDAWQTSTLEAAAECAREAGPPLYALAIGAEAGRLIAPLARRGIPTTSLLESATFDAGREALLAGILDWAMDVVFPSQLAQSRCFQRLPTFQPRAGLHVKTIDRLALNPQRTAAASQNGVTDVLSAFEVQNRPAFVVAGAGPLSFAGGADLFLATAAAALRLRPDLPLHFVWFGTDFGLDPGFTQHLKELSTLLELGEKLTIVHAVFDIVALCEKADAVFLAARRENDPVLGFHAIAMGLPTVCFEGLSAAAEVLAAQANTCSLVVPSLDIHLAAERLCSLAEDVAARDALRADMVRVAQTRFNFDTYLEEVDQLGRAAADQMADEAEFLLVPGTCDHAMLSRGEEHRPDGSLEYQTILSWRQQKTWYGAPVSIQYRRPCPGFHPLAYAEAHAADCIEGRGNPLAHWIRAGRPDGLWRKTVLTPENMRFSGVSTLRAAVHLHCYYPELAADFLSRVARNQVVIDLFLSTDTTEKASDLRRAAQGFPGKVSIEVVPNRGRDIGPFLTGLAPVLEAGSYDVVGHFHCKKSLDLANMVGERWRTFLWENLVGGAFPMLDLAMGAFAQYEKLGLLMADEPQLIGWGSNRPTAEALLGRMGILEPLPDFFDFPVGTMFLARTAALRSMFDLRLAWEDYPDEPVPFDGTLLHALERIVPFATRHGGFEVMGVRVPGSTW